MSIMLWTYIVYLVVSAVVAWCVGRVLKTSGPIFVARTNGENLPFIKSLTQLLVMGFYLIAFGAICFLLQFGRVPSTTESAIETLSVKIGAVLLTIGCMHFFVIARLAQFRNSFKPRASAVPFAKPADMRDE